MAARTNCKIEANKSVCWLGDPNILSLALQLLVSLAKLSWRQSFSIFEAYRILLYCVYSENILENVG